MAKGFKCLRLELLFFVKGFSFFFVCIIERVFLFSFFKTCCMLVLIFVSLLKYEICSFFCDFLFKLKRRHSINFTVFFLSVCYVKCCRQLSDYLFLSIQQIRNIKQRWTCSQYFWMFLLSNLNITLTWRQFLCLLIRISSNIDIEENFCVLRMGFFSGISKKFLLC